MCVHHVHAWCQSWSEEGDGSPGTGVTNGCERPGRCWEANMGSAQEQQVLLTAESFVQLPSLGFIFDNIPSHWWVKNGVSLLEFPDHEPLNY